ncbi:alpha-glucan family phosphorylase [Salinicola avicenniae]|uniref:alpha-glucan family phosphorylase n=1 Tax=Salinicola avicenniae TaxID=2916836 RepID=UPI0020743A76|nr:MULTISPECIES: alpha-glucan family phosphorylase [unclassified Salinicola]
MAARDETAGDMPDYEHLVELALDLSCTWHQETDWIWRALDARLWHLTHNPWAVLQTVSRERLHHFLSDAGTAVQLRALIAARRVRSEHHAETPLGAGDTPFSIAYFSMEFMLSEALPIYSGGLGNVAGDQLKAASDFHLPVIGVGLLYQRGYFRQTLDAQGHQQALYPYNDPGQLPISPVRTAQGEWLRIEVALPGYSIWLRIWEARVGNTRLYLLDSNDVANYPVYRGITSELYGGDEEVRLKQEMLLGLGGWRLLEMLDIRPEVCHLNEGHAALVVLERARSRMEQHGEPFDVAFAITRAGNLFTTHTAVEAGFDRFSPSLIVRYLGEYADHRLGIGIDALLALGRSRPEDASERFNMAYLACRGSRAVNGVSRLHGRVSRAIFQPLFPRWPTWQIPIAHITNGVHMPTWSSPAAESLWMQFCCQPHWLSGEDVLGAAMEVVPAARLWELHKLSSRQLIAYARELLARQVAVSGGSPESIERARHVLDPEALTLGFARRFATYKRPNLLLHDPERLVRLLSSATRPVQLLVAGKAHPADRAGQEMIRQWVDFSRRPDVRASVIFLADYDMRLTQELVRGVDVWINTPRRPWEACGTSGMKVLVNGGLNLSELDGWWVEAYRPDLGWALGDGEEHGDDPAWDTRDAEVLYARLENEIVPAFYDRDEHGVPQAWVARMRASMSRLTPRFSASRMLGEYYRRYYRPLAAAFREREANAGALGREIADWQRGIEQAWPAVGFGECRVTSEPGHHHFAAQVHLGGLVPSAIRVELYADETPAEAAVCLAMEADTEMVGESCRFTLSLATERDADDFSLRARPWHDAVALPLEDPRILWQR